MVHIFHNKETPLYKRFPDGWATKAKWKTLPPSHITQETQYHQIREIHIEENQKNEFM